MPTVPDLGLGLSPPITAGVVGTCVSGGRLCALRDETVLVVTATEEAWGAFASQLGGLGLALRSCGPAGPAPLQPGEIVSLILIDAAGGGDGAGGQVQAVLADRPWVPVLTGLQSGFAVPAGLADELTKGAFDMAPRPLRRAVVESLCRLARHAPLQPECTKVPGKKPGHS